MNEFSGVEAGFDAAFSAPSNSVRTLEFVPSEPTIMLPLAEVPSSNEAVTVFPSSLGVMEESLLLYYRLSDRAEGTRNHTQEIYLHLNTLRTESSHFGSIESHMLRFSHRIHELARCGIVDIEILDIWVLVERVTLSLIQPLVHFVGQYLLQQRRAPVDAETPLPWSVCCC